MKYLLYIFRSFGRKTSRHITIAIVIICAFILPFSVCIFRDSVIYGQELYVLDNTKGETYHLTGAREEYLGRFSSVPGLSARYENGCIYIRILSSAEAADPARERQYAEMVSDIADDIGDENLHLSSYAYFGADESNDIAASQWLIILVAAAFITLLVLVFSYRDHIRGFSSDIGDLRAMGASRRQVFLLFFTELIVLLTVSSAIAAAGASLMMRILFERFFKVMNVQNLAWLVFRVNIWNLLAITATFLCVMALVLSVSLHKLNRAAIVHLMREDAEGNVIKHYRRKLRARKSAVSTIKHLLLERVNARYIACLLISVPAAVAFIVSTNTVLANIAKFRTTPEFALIITQTSPAADGSWFTDEDLRSISEIDGVANAEIASVITRRVYVNGVLQDADRTSMAPNQIRISLSDEQKHQSVETWLRSVYAGQQYNVQNDYEVYEKNQVSIVGLLYMLVFLLAVMLLLAAIVLCAKLYYFILAQRANIRGLYGIGASRNTLTRTYMGQARHMAVRGMVIALVFAVVLLHLLYRGGVYSPYVSAAVAGLNIGCVILFIASYSCPVRFALKYVMREAGAEERCQNGYT